MKNAKIYIDLNYLDYVLKMHNEDLKNSKAIPNFIRHISSKNYKILEIVCIGDFEMISQKNKIQKYLYDMNIKTIFHPFGSDDSNSTMLITEATSNLFLNNTIDIFIMISKSNNILPLVNLIISSGKEIIVSDSKIKLPENLFLTKENTIPFEDFIKLNKLSLSAEEVAFNLNKELGKINLEDVPKETLKEADVLYDFLVNSPLYLEYNLNKFPKNSIGLSGFMKHYCTTFNKTQTNARYLTLLLQKMNKLEVYRDEEKEILCIRKK